MKLYNFINYERINSKLKNSKRKLLQKEQCHKYLSQNIKSCVPIFKNPLEIDISMPILLGVNQSNKTHPPSVAMIQVGIQS